LVIALVLFVVLGAIIKIFPNLQIDVWITREIQENNLPFFSNLMIIVSAIGYMPWELIVIVGGMIGLIVAKLRREAVIHLISAASISLIGVGLKTLVGRARPSLEVVNVIHQSQDPSFPSGHVLFYTVYFGFLAYLVFSLFHPSWKRNILLAILVSLVILIGPSRIYLGSHWTTDVLGSYLLGSSWLLITIFVYQKSRSWRFVKNLDQV
jgi:undecaprenyl-diphosphatase